MADETLLINLNSPEQINTIPCQKTYLKNPLIPSPDLNCNTEGSNPFDYVAQCAEFWDPFEKVLHESLKKVENAQNGECKNSASCLVDPTKMLKNISSPEQINKRHKFTRSHSVSDNCRFFNSPKKNVEKPSPISISSPENSPVNTSLTERIKRVVQRRVSKCIEKALRNSLSQPDLSNTEPPSPCKNRVEPPIINKNISLPINQNRYKRIPDSECGQLSQSLYSPNNNENNNMKDIFKEAQYISSLIKSFTKSPSSNIEYEPLESEKILSEEDLMSIKPPWEENSLDLSLSSESDDSSIGLPKVKLFYLKKKAKDAKNEKRTEEIEKLKKRIRASLDGNFSCDEDSPPSKTAEEEKSKAVVPNSPASNTSSGNHKIVKDLKDPVPVNIPALPEVNDLRPKKRGNILKKGPLKAIVPLQKMTKTFAEKISSPMRKTGFHSLNNSKSSQNDSSLSSSIIFPVAASTPNGKGSSSASGTPSAYKNKPRQTRQDSEPTRSMKFSYRRSSSLSSDSRNSKAKVPFTSVNANVTENKSGKSRPSSAPSKSGSCSNRSSPQGSKDAIRRRNISPVTEHDKENRLLS